MILQVPPRLLQQRASGEESTHVTEGMAHTGQKAGKSITFLHQDRRGDPTAAFKQEWDTCRNSLTIDHKSLSWQDLSSEPIRISQGGKKWFSISSVTNSLVRGKSHMGHWKHQEMCSLTAVRVFCRAGVTCSPLSTSPRGSQPNATPLWYISPLSQWGCSHQPHWFSRRCQSRDHTACITNHRISRQKLCHAGAQLFHQEFHWNNCSPSSQQKKAAGVHRCCYRICPQRTKQLKHSGLM